MKRRNGEFSRRLRRLRESQGKSRRMVSELCGLSPDAVRRYERGEAEPTMGVLERLADYFGVSMDYLSGRAEK